MSTSLPYRTLQYGAACILLCSCSLTEYRDVTVKSDPEGARVYLNGEYAGDTPVVHEVANRKPLAIYIYKTGFRPVEQTIMPEEGFWGWLFWSGINDKGRSLPHSEYSYTLEQVKPGEFVPFDPPLPPKKSKPARSFSRHAIQ